MDVAPTTGIRGLATQVKPPFMAPAVGTGLFGALLAPSFAPAALAVHLTCVASALYVAHLRDEYVDAHVRGEDDPSVAASLLGPAVATASLVFVAACAALWMISGPVAAGLAFPLWLLAVFHAPYLDTNPVTGSLDYPVAVGLVLAGGYYAQTGGVPTWLAWPVAAFVLLLAGANVSLDRTDEPFDRTVGKRTVPVVLGDSLAARVAGGLVVCSGFVTLAGVAAGDLPPPAVAAAVFPLSAGVLTVRASPARAVRIQMVGSYPFAATLYAAACLGAECVLLGVVGSGP